MAPSRQYLRAKARKNCAQSTATCSNTGDSDPAIGENTSENIEKVAKAKIPVTEPNYPDVAPQSPVVSSPTGTASTASSPGNASDVWDTPETPIQKSIKRTATLTPLTPSSVYDVSVKRECYQRPPKSLFDVDVSKNTNGFSKLLEADVGKALNEYEDEDYFFKPKLIRNMTKEFEKISKATAAAAQGHFDLNPSFEFSGSPKAVAKKQSSTTYNQSQQTSAIKLESPDDGTETQPKTKTSKVNSKSFEAMLNQIVPSNIHSRLKEAPSQCVASLVKDPDRRCVYKHNRPKEDAEEIFTHLLRYREEGKYPKFPEQIEKLVKVVMCRPHQKAALVGADDGRRMKELRKLTSAYSEASKEDLAVFKKWETAILNPNTPPNPPKAEMNHESQTKGKLVKSPSSPQAHKTNNPTIKAISFFHQFERWQPRWSRGLSPTAALLEYISKPLTPTDEKDGYIYIFWDKAHFGKVKIGRTNDLQRRLKEWNRTCKREHNYHGESKAGGYIEIPHVNRIENLMHIELKEYREKRKCEGCGKPHDEWFNISEVQAIKVLEKWEKWILQKPYKIDPVSGKWRVASKMKKTLEEVCEDLPMEAEAETKQAKPRRKSEGVRGGKKKRAARWTM